MLVRNNNLEPNKMTLDIQSRIDTMTKEQLAWEFCYATIDSPLFLGELGAYFTKRLQEVDAVALALTYCFRFIPQTKLLELTANPAE